MSVRETPVLQTRNCLVLQKEKNILSARRLILVTVGVILTLGISGLALVAPTASAQTPIVPLLFIPGYAASSPHPGTILEYTFNRGAQPQSLDLSACYSSFVRSLMNAGYVEGWTFFGAVYDWRMAVAPADGNFDGTLDLVTAQEMTSGIYQYGVNYLGHWLDQAVQANPGLQYVDVVTHSTGGIVARSYIQSPAYGASYLDANGIIRNLPKIRYLILGACVNFGTVHGWRPWHADFQDVLGGFIPTTEIEGRFAAAAFAVVSTGGSVNGPDYTITRPLILRRDLRGRLRPDPTTFFRLYDPNRQTLMATSDFLLPPGQITPTNVNDDPTLRSDVLLDLNAGSSPGHNPWVVNVGIRGVPKQGGVIATFASGARQKTSPLDFVIPGRVNQNDYVCTLTGIVQLSDNEGFFLPLLELLRPNPMVIPVSQSLFARIGDNEVNRPLSGDGNGFFESYLGNFLNDPHVTLVRWGNGPVPTTPPSASTCNADAPNPLPAGVAWGNLTDYPVYHDVFFYNPDVRKFVVTTLTGVIPGPEAVITRMEWLGLLRFLNGGL